MKKVLYYLLFMVTAIVILPFLIIKGCSSPTTDVIPPLNEGTKIHVFIFAENKVEEMGLDEYIKGVIAAEMPVEFDLEALKAQAIAARTYALARVIKRCGAEDDTHNGADICTDSKHCQAWVSKAKAIERWGNDRGKENWRKIEEAVLQTQNLVMMYQGAIANPVYHSNSGGMTEDSEDVWEGVHVPYLKSVLSLGEENNSEFKNSVSFKDTVFLSKLKKEYPDFKTTDKDILKNIKILTLSKGNRVMTIKIGNKTLKGTDIRRILELRSTNFTIDRDEKGDVRVTTFGNGHGVGMSQWGANSLAKEGFLYNEILSYYYTGIDIVNLGNK